MYFIGLADEPFRNEDDMRNVEDAISGKGFGEFQVLEVSALAEQSR